MADQTSVVIYVNYCNTNLYYIFIIKNYPYYMAKSHKNITKSITRDQALATSSSRCESAHAKIIGVRYGYISSIGFVL